MKNRSAFGRKLRYGGVSAVLTALIIAVVIILNVLFSALAQRFLWYTDLTPEFMFTLSEEALKIVEFGDEKFDTQSPIERVKEDRAAGINETINIIFCAEPDTLKNDISQYYVYETALELEKNFPDYISVEEIDIIKNPSAVSRFKTNSLSEIHTSSVIIEYGTEYRVRELRSFYIFDTEDTDKLWAYNGEKAFVSSILAVTRAATPVACITLNHGETFDIQTMEFVNTLTDAGYDVLPLYLDEEEIPADCRLIVVFDPKEDFSVFDPSSPLETVDELDKLDAFLDAGNSLMVFMNPATEKLTNFEEFLGEWGIQFNRSPDPANEQKLVSHLVEDRTQSIQSANRDAYTFRAEYAIGGLGSSLTEDMRSRSTPQKMIFRNAMSISYADNFKPTTYVPDESSTDENDVQHEYGLCKDNGISRSIFDVFVTSDGAEAYAGGPEPVEEATATERIKLMTVSVENKYIQEDNYSTANQPAYVLACGTTDIVQSELLQSGAYGNTDFFLTALRAIGGEAVPVGLDFKPFADDTIDTVTTREATQYTVVLAVVPAVLALGAGIVVIVRRKNR
ncbi:MAG: hypothetical protein E7677_00380 [Ruminococcaceae bacterium]|nr:hypothetical protein [Oscillospiraceae bacterium]